MASPQRDLRLAHQDGGVQEDRPIAALVGGDGAGNIRGYRTVLSTTGLHIGLRHRKRGDDIGYTRFRPDSNQVHGTTP